MSDLSLAISSRRSHVPTRHTPLVLDPGLADRLDALLGVSPNRELRRVAQRLARGGQGMERPEQILPVIAHAILGVVRTGGRVHVVSLSDAATRLGAALAEPMAQLGVPVGVIEPGAPIAGRAKAYAQPVVCVGAQDVALDVLRGRHAGVRQDGLRGSFANLAARPATARLTDLRAVDLALVLDAEDSLIARSLIGVVLTGTAQGGTEATHIPATEALSVAGLLEADHFRVAGEEVRLSSDGRDRLSVLVQTLGPGWANPARAELAASRALAALHLWQEGRDFLLNEDGALQLSDALGALAHANPGLDPEHLLNARHRFAAASAPNTTTLNRTPLRAVMALYPRLSCMIADAPRHRDELRAAYDIRVFGRTRAPESAVCLHPSLLPDHGGPVYLSGGTARDADRLRALPSLDDLIWPTPGEPPKDPGRSLVLSQSGHLWPHWAVGPAVIRIRLLPARDADETPGWLVRALSRMSWIHRALFFWQERARLTEDRHQRQALYYYDRSCRNAVSILGNETG